MNQQHPPTTRQKDVEIDWRGLIGGVFIIAFFYFTGLLILVSLALRWWAARSSWHAPDRWASIRTFAWLFPLFYLPIWILHVQIGLFWTTHGLGVFQLWPPTIDALGARFVLALPLAPALALFIERSSPRTVPLRYMIRRPRPGEILEPVPLKTDPVTLPTAEADSTSRAPVPAASTENTSRSRPAPAPKRRTARDPRPIGETLLDEAQRIKAQSSKTPAQDSPQSRSETSRGKTNEHDDGSDDIDWSRVKE